MCVRCGLWQERAEIEDRLDAKFQFDYEPLYNIAPEGGGVPAVRNESPDEIDTHRWGLLPSWVDDPDDFPNLFTARAETVAERNSFRSAFKKRRCLVRANNFYEWTGR